MRFAAVAILLSTLSSVAGQARADDAPDFHREVLPVLKQHCFSCHSGATNMPKRKLRLDRKTDLEDRGRRR
jgi:hypothetical protein